MRVIQNDAGILLSSLNPSEVLAAIAECPASVLKEHPLTILVLMRNLDKLRFRPLADLQTWNSAVTNGIFIRFRNVELSHDEILTMAEQEH